MGGFYRGFMALPRGARVAFGDASLRRWLIAPVVLAAVLLVAVIATGAWYLARRVDGAVATLEVVGAMLLGCVGAVLLALEPFGGSLSDRAEEIASCTTLPPTPVVQRVADAVRGIGHFCAGLIAYALVAGALLLGTVVLPWLAPLFTLVHVLQTALFVAFNAFDPALSRRRLGFGEKWRWVGTEHRAQALGLGTATTLFLAVPVVGLLASPLSIVAAALLVTETEAAARP